MLDFSDFESWAKSYCEENNITDEYVEEQANRYRSKSSYEDCSDNAEKGGNYWNDDD